VCLAVCYRGNMTEIEGGVSGGVLPWEYDRERESEMHCDSVRHSAVHDVCMSLCLLQCTLSVATLPFARD
jgi:hypothetical protein